MGKIQCIFSKYAFWNLIDVAHAEFTLCKWCFYCIVLKLTAWHIFHTVYEYLQYFGLGKNRKDIRRTLLEKFKLIV